MDLEKSPSPSCGGIMSVDNILINCSFGTQTLSIILTYDFL